MLASTRRSFAALLAAFALACVLSGSAQAAGRNQLISKGVYDGLWHGDKVTFIVENVERDGKFSGIIHFDPNGRWGDVKSNFTGEVCRGDEIVIDRPDCDQHSRAGAPRRAGRRLVWKGTTSGGNLDA